MFRKIFAASLLAFAANAADGSFDYKDDGQSWTGTCATGREQSPIDLTRDGKTELSDKQKVVLNDKYPEGGMTFVDKEHTVNVQMKADEAPDTDAFFKKTLQDGTVYSFSPYQFHFHSPSEHTINGKRLDFEIHIVHAKNDKAAEDPRGAGVLGFFFDRELGGDATNPFLEQIANNLPDSSFATSYGGGVKTKSGTPNVWFKGWLDTIDFDNFWSYPGSLTTPGCGEIVEWTVIDDIQPISEAQLNKFKALFRTAGVESTSRKTQPLNDRTLYYVAPAEKAIEEATAAAVTFGVLFGVFAVILIAVLAIVFCKPSIFSLKKVEKAADAGNANKN